MIQLSRLSWSKPSQEVVTVVRACWMGQQSAGDIMKWVIWVMAPPRLGSPRWRLCVGINNATAIIAGSAHTCARLADGSAKCWGYNYFGQLGDGTTTNRLTPVAVQGIRNATAITAGGGHTCTRLSDGSAKCWGWNGNGQLGDGTTTVRLTPVLVW